MCAPGFVALLISGLSGSAAGSEPATEPAIDDEEILEESWSVDCEPLLEPAMDYLLDALEAEAGAEMDLSRAAPGSALAASDGPAPAAADPTLPEAPVIQPAVYSAAALSAAILPAVGVSAVGPPEQEEAEIRAGLSRWLQGAREQDVSCQCTWLDRERNCELSITVPVHAGDPLECDCSDEPSTRECESVVPTGRLIFADPEPPARRRGRK